MATGGSSSSSVPSGGAGSGSVSADLKARLLRPDPADCNNKDCFPVRVLVHVNEHRKAIVALHAIGDRQPDHVIVINIKADDEDVQTTYGIDVSAGSDEDYIQVMDEWYSAFRLDKTGVFYDSKENAVIYGVPRGHPGVDLPRYLTILPTPKKKQLENDPAAGSSSSAVGAAAQPPPGLVLLTPDQTTSTDKRRRFSFPDQRKRIKSMTKSDLEYYLHKTQKEAADIGLSIGTTALKSICRANSLPKWPYRKILKIDNEFDNSLKKKITQSSNLGRTVDGVTKAFEIRKKKEALYQQIMADIPEELQGIDGIVDELQDAYNAGLHIGTDDEEEEQDE
ncbi:hypothetical protein ABZP36_035325 [Zizania latifolia]